MNLIVYRIRSDNGAPPAYNERQVESLQIGKDAAASTGAEITVERIRSKDLPLRELGMAFLTGGWEDKIEPLKVYARTAARPEPATDEIIHALSAREILIELLRRGDQIEEDIVITIGHRPENKNAEDDQHQRNTDTIQRDQTEDGDMSQYRSHGFVDIGDKTPSHAAGDQT